MNRESLQAHGLCIEASSGRTLLSELCLSLGRERVALVGRNGVGKSSLLEVLAGNEPPRRGRVIANGPRLLVRQDLGDASALSPGEQRRLALDDARRLRPEVLLLDEPTRDLDASNIAWLVEWLRDWDRALIVVSHDRRVLRHFRLFFIVAESGCRPFEGTFDELVEELARAERETSCKYARNLVRLLDKEEHTATVRRRRDRKKNVGRIRELGRCPARIRLNGKRSYKQVSQATRELLQRDRISAMREWAHSSRRALFVSLPLSVVLPELPADAGRAVMTLQRISAVSRGRVLFREIDLSLGRERVAITGPNGSGKSTLLGIALQERAPDAGQASTALERVGFIAQNAANFRREESLLELLVTGSEAATPERAAELLATHGFPFALAARPLRSLSPGERVRAGLIVLFQRRPAIELLVLDEPTDDLDLQATLALEATLRAWRGGLLVASHDPEFLQTIGFTRHIELGATS